MGRFDSAQRPVRELVGSVQWSIAEIADSGRDSRKVDSYTGVTEGHHNGRVAMPPRRLQSRDFAQRPPRELGEIAPGLVPVLVHLWVNMRVEDSDREANEPHRNS
jgi:hypothetical protein